MRCGMKGRALGLARVRVGAISETQTAHSGREAAGLVRASDKEGSCVSVIKFFRVHVICRPVTQDSLSGSSLEWSSVGSLLIDRLLLCNAYFGLAWNSATWIVTGN